MNNHLVQKTWFSNIWKTEQKRNKVNDNQMFPWNNSNFMHRYNVAATFTNISMIVVG